MSSYPSKKHILWLFLIFCSRVSVKTSKNEQKLPKLINFLFFCIFHENRRILNCFHRRYEFCMQKYPIKHIFYRICRKDIITSNFIKGDKTESLQNFKISNFALFVFFSSKNIFYYFSDILLKSFSENLKKLSEIAKTNHFSFFLHFSRKS